MLSNNGQPRHQLAAACSHAVSLQVNPLAKRVNSRLEFSFVYPDKRGRNVMRVVGLQSLQQTHTSVPAAHSSSTHMCKQLAKCYLLCYRTALVPVVYNRGAVHCWQWRICLKSASTVPAMHSACIFCALCQSLGEQP